MPSKHISSISVDTEQHVSYHFDTIQEMIEFERFLQENTFEKYQQDQEISFDVAEAAIKKSLVLPESYGEIVSCEVKPCPWIVNWEELEEEIGPEYKWFAVDADGEKFVYTGHPQLDCDEEEGYFYPDVDEPAVRLISSKYIIQKGTVPWYESLVKKPEKELGIFS